MNIKRKRFTSKLVAGLLLLSIGYVLGTIAPRAAAEWFPTDYESLAGIHKELVLIRKAVERGTR